MTSNHRLEIIKNERYTFGKNWQSLIKIIDEKKIKAAQKNLLVGLGLSDLKGMKFLDIGSGSGLFSLAAYSLGAKVLSFDYDPVSVKCTNELKKIYFPNANDWVIEEGSVLDKKYLQRLGSFNIVYSWGVLHHTGNMWKALKNLECIGFDYLFIAIYNDQGFFSKYWHIVKQKYNSNIIFRIFIIIAHWPYLFLFRFIKSKIENKVETRGMNLWIDMLDWLGGFPFEVSSPEKIIHFFYNQKLMCHYLKTCRGRFGCNEYVFVKSKLIKDKNFE